MAKGDELPDNDHVLRYVRSGHVDRTGRVEHVTTSAFLCRPDEIAASVNWMQCFDPPVDNQCKCIREEKRLTYGRNDRLARLSIGQAKNYVITEAEAALGKDAALLGFEHDPL